MAIKWTTEELEAMAAFDAEIDAEDDLTDDEILASEARDRMAAGNNKPKRSGPGSYYERNREYCKARQRAYTEKHRDEINEKARARRATNLEVYRARQRELLKKNREKYSGEQKIIREYRKARNMTQKEFGAAIGKSEATIENWERGNSKANWKLIAKFFPDFPIGKAANPVCETEKAAFKKQPIKL